MPRSKVSGVIVSHVWGDDSEQQFNIKVKDLNETGPCVTIEAEGQILYFQPESWGEIRDQIQAMMDDIEGEK